MNYVMDNVRESDGVLACANCETPIGPTSDGYLRLAGTFDLSLDTGQSAGFAPNTSRYALRHYACRTCGSLFDVEMIALEGVATEETE